MRDTKKIFMFMYKTEMILHISSHTQIKKKKKTPTTTIKYINICTIFS